MSNYFRIQELKARILDLKYYGVENVAENYLLKYPKRTKIQAINYAEKIVKKKIKELKDEITYLESDNLVILTPKVYHIN